MKIQYEDDSVKYHHEKDIENGDKITIRFMMKNTFIMINMIMIKIMIIKIMMMTRSI